MGIPELDEELRRRLGRRYGSAIDPWFDSLPAVLSDLAERWGIEWGGLIQRGSMSAVIRCRAADGRAAVLKVSPERARIAHEARALASWSSAHVPDVLAVDATVGALLIEAIEPGTPMVESTGYPGMDSIAALLTSLHNGVPDQSFPPVADHIAYLFDSSTKLYERKPALVELISPELYERGRGLALRLAADTAPPQALLHGDLTPVNVLDGGQRGLVAIDPAPCLGDSSFDAVDLVFWRADDADTIEARAGLLAPAIRVDSARLLYWCIAFAGMVALELAEAGSGSREQIESLAALARRVS